MTESFLKMGLANIDGSFDLGADVIYRGEKPVMRGTMFLIILKNLKEYLI